MRCHVDHSQVRSVKSLQIQSYQSAVAGSSRKQETSISQKFCHQIVVQILIKIWRYFRNILLVYQHTVTSRNHTQVLSETAVCDGSL